MADFDALMKGMSLFNDGMQKFATTRALGQAQDQLQQVNAMEGDEIAKRNQLAQVAQNLTLNMTKAGASTAQVQQAAGSIMPEKIDSPESAFYQGQLTGSPKLQQIAQAGMDFKGQNDLKKQGLELASKERIARMNVDAVTGKGNDKRISSFIESLDPNKARTGTMGKSQQVINDSESLDALAANYKNLNDLPTPQYAEMAMALNRLATRGNPSVEGLKHLMPPNIEFSGANVMTWLKSNPQGAEQGQFVKNILMTSASEKQAAMDQLKKAQYQKMGILGADDLQNPRVQSALDHYGLNMTEHQHFLKTRSLLPAAGAATEQMVRVMAPSGKIVSVPASQVDAAVKAGGAKL